MSSFIVANPLGVGILIGSVSCGGRIGSVSHLVYVVNVGFCAIYYLKEFSRLYSSFICTVSVGFDA